MSSGVIGYGRAVYGNKYIVCAKCKVQWEDTPLTNSPEYMVCPECSSYLAASETGYKDIRKFSAPMLRFGPNAYPTSKLKRLWKVVKNPFVYIWTGKYEIW